MTNTVILYPAPSGISPSDRYAVTINGMASFTYLTTGPAEAEYTAGHTASWTSFDVGSPCEVRIRRLGRSVREAVVRPLSAGIHPQVEDGEVVMELDRPRKLCVECDGDLTDVLFLFANEPETEVPSPDDPNVVWFGPGVHEIGKFYPLKAAMTYNALRDNGGSRVCDCDVIHQMPFSAPDSGWGPVFYSPHGGSAHIFGITFDDIRIEGDIPSLIIIHLQRNPWSPQEGEWGRFSRLTFRNITVEGVCRGPNRLLGHDETHGIADVSIENLTIAGRRIDSQAAMNLETNAFVTGLRIDGNEALCERGGELISSPLDNTKG